MTDHIARQYRRPSRVRRPIAVHTLLALLVAAAACRGAETEHEEKIVAEVSASTASIDTGTFVELFESAGLVTARTGHAAALSAPASTRVTQVHVAVGDQVAIGAPLVSLDATPFDAAYNSAQAALAAAQHAADRATRLVAAGIAPRRDAETAAAELAAAQATATNARRIRELATLKAPIAGVVSRVVAVLGASVDVGQTLVELVDPSHLDVVLQVPANVAARLRIGQDVSFNEDAGEGATKVGSGRIVDVSAVVDSSTRAVSVRATLDSRERTVRIGETLFGQVTASRHPGVVLIPDEALVPFEEGYRVFVVDSESIAHARSVEVGGREAHKVWITDGLKRGEIVVTAGAFGMDDGAKVAPAESKQPEREPTKEGAKEPAKEPAKP